jgi:hypothetical protein
MSSFAAFATILGGNLGVGNISGTAIALSTGGPGSIFWMAVIIIFASVIKYAGCYLGLEYRLKLKGRYIGGPMYFLRDGANLRFVAKLFWCAALRSALSLRAGSDSVLALRNHSGIVSKTSHLAEAFTRNGINRNHSKILVILHEKDENLVRSASNLHYIKVLWGSAANVYDVLLHDVVIIDEASLRNLESRLSS